MAASWLRHARPPGPVAAKSWVAGPSPAMTQSAGAGAEGFGHPAMTHLAARARL